MSREVPVERLIHALRELLWSSLAPFQRDHVNAVKEALDVLEEIGEWPPDDG